MSSLTRWVRVKRVRSIVIMGALAGILLYGVGLAVVNFQALAYKFIQISLILGFVHFVRKEMFPYHDMEDCSDIRALGMFIFMGSVVVAFMVGL